MILLSLSSSSGLVRRLPPTVSQIDAKVVPQALPHAPDERTGPKQSTKGPSAGPPGPAVDANTATVAVAQGTKQPKASGRPNSSRSSINNPSTNPDSGGARNARADNSGGQISSVLVAVAEKQRKARQLSACSPSTRRAAAALIPSLSVAKRTSRYCQRADDDVDDAGTKPRGSDEVNIRAEYLPFKKRRR